MRVHVPIERVRRRSLNLPKAIHVGEKSILQDVARFENNECSLKGVLVVSRRSAYRSFDDHGFQVGSDLE